MRNWVKIAVAAMVMIAGEVCSPMAAQAQSGSLSNDPDLQTNLPTLTKVGQIRRLSPREAERHYPVLLNGVVLDYSRLQAGIMYLSDATGAVIVRVAGEQPVIRGQAVEVTGMSDAGGFAPEVALSKLRVLGMGALPAPLDAPIKRISSGLEDGQWVRVAGIVRAVAFPAHRKGGGPHIVVVTEDGGRISLFVHDYQDAAAGSLVDAEVTVTGIIKTLYNYNRQLINCQMLVPSMNSIEIKRAAPSSVLTGPPRAIGSLRQFSTEEPSGHRVKLLGIVTLQQPGASIFIKDDTGTIQARTEQRDLLSPGDRVEVLGFPAASSPMLEDAVFHKVGSGPAPQPVDVNGQQEQRGDYETELIRVNGQLLDQFTTPDQTILMLQMGDILFRAQLARSQALHLDLRNGARLQVTGVCQAQRKNYSLAPDFVAFQMNLRSPEDLTVTRQAPWWTPGRLRWASTILTGGLLVAGVWVWLLRRQVAIQTEAIRNKIEREAILQERMRIAREFHDSLEQELAGVRMQLELTAATVTRAPERAAASLELAKTMISHSQAEARRSVWELRSQILESSTLPAALCAAVQGVECVAPIEVNVTGRTFALPMRVESNLLRIAQEAICNAIKHAKPRRISVDLAYEAAGARLKILDDGCGFCVASAPNGQTGHFGLLGMKERVDKMAGTLRIASAPDQGACVEVFVPRAQDAPSTSLK